MISRVVTLQFKFGGDSYLLSTPLEVAENKHFHETT
jgi:hypothetical protein